MILANTNTTQKRANIILLNQEPLSARANLSLRVTVSACRQRSPQTALSSMNPRTDHLFDQAREGRHISIKFRPISYLTRKSSKPKQSKWREIFLSCLRRKNLRTYLLSPNDDDEAFLKYYLVHL